MKKTDPNAKSDGTVRSPYGPHHGQVDESAGGADSSPAEALSSEERHEGQQTAPPPPPETRE